MLEARGKRVYLLAGLLAAVAGSLSATGTLTLTCSLNVTGVAGPLSGLGSVDANGCFSTSFGNITTLDSLNWGAPTAAAGPGGLGLAIAGNSFDMTGGPVATWTATQDGREVGIEAAPGYSGTATSVTRADNFALEFNGTTWVRPTAMTPVLENFAGHFASASQDAPSAAGNAHLLETSGGPLELTLLGGPAYGIWFQIASLSAGKNTLFVAKVQAFDSSDNPIGSYQLTESGPYGTGGTCATLNANWVVPCNDAPYVGFYDPEGRIRSIYISVFDPSNLTTPIGFAINSLQLDEVPEPAMMFMIGGGLAAIALYGRKRRARLG